jgi:hypothetical protein
MVEIEEMHEAAHAAIVVCHMASFHGDLSSARVLSSSRNQEARNRYVSGDPPPTSLSRRCLSLLSLSLLPLHPIGATDLVDNHTVQERYGDGGGDGDGDWRLESLRRAEGEGEGVLCGSLPLSRRHPFLAHAIEYANSPTNKNTHKAGRKNPLTFCSKSFFLYLGSQERKKP